ncbi:cell division protein ZapE [Luteimonas sp. BDR2-5]|nr:cell division protein ZapE [Luteimonas sp. BDR2-5]MCD9029554.1 cell division protein ZapE [Luteimonas sp. BDR2-5]
MSAWPLPSQRYADGVARGDWQDDPAQHPALAELDRLHRALTTPPPRRGMLGRLLGADPAEAIPGLYLWGGVGRGKTFMIDLFHDGLPLEVLRAEGPTEAPLPSHGRGGDRSQGERWGEGEPTAEPALIRPSGTFHPEGAQSRHAGEGTEPRHTGWGEGEPAAKPAPIRRPGIAPPDPKLGRKRRTHFHRFMREVHEALRAHAGERDPLAAIVRGWREARLRVLVLDEFFVSDIGDAMLLARLLERMFAEGIVLVTTSNAAPQDLYRDGLQRARFLPAIALIERHCHVLYLESDTDYRLRALTRSPVYRSPLDAQSDPWLDTRWHELGGDDAHRDAGIEVDGRRIPVRARCTGMVWFDFDALCEGPRGASDYIHIATEFHTVLVGGVPVMDGHRDDAARRFVTLIDELYDRSVNLVCTADAEPPLLYAGERLAGAFERTASRLIEMRSAEYLLREHRG